jgi:hypothetical protein
VGVYMSLRVYIVEMENNQWAGSTSGLSSLDSPKCHTELRLRTGIDAGIG